MAYNSNKIYKTHFIRQVSDTVYVVRFDKHNISFFPGQHILLGIDEKNMREYSVYSGLNEDFFEVLIKEVSDGSVSKQLHKLEPNDPVLLENPVGFFRINKSDIDKEFLFIASGTGISPFHSMIKSYPELNYRLLHGIPYLSESYDADDYAPDKLIRCTSKTQEGEFSGRVTDWLRLNHVNNNTLVFLCGNSNMILEAREILLSSGFPVENINTEVYF